MTRFKNARFEISVGQGSAYPQLDGVPQIAIVGKSNVGKSSFINGMCGNSKLARVSATPGKTRLINYFSINNGQFYLVDLPGYGFARASKEEQRKWGELIEDYLRSGQVNHIFLLLDSRHSPTEDDKLMFRWIEHYCLPYTIIATKIDKHAKSKRAQASAAVNAQIGALSPAIGFSTQDQNCREKVWQRIFEIVNDFESNLNNRAAEISME